MKEVGRESEMRFRHFIANKEQASIKADINLPVIVFRNKLKSVHLYLLLIKWMDHMIRLFIISHITLTIPQDDML